MYSISVLIYFICVPFIINEATLILHDHPVEFVKWVEVIPLPNYTLSLVGPEEPNVTGKLVYMDFPLYGSKVFLFPFIDEITQLKNRGALGIVTCMVQERKLYGYYSYGNFKDRVQLTAGFINKHSYNYYKQHGPIMNATFISWDHNPWDIVFGNEGFIAYSIILFLLFMINVIYAIYKIIKWRLTRGEFILAVGLICLFLELLVNIIRAIQAFVSPAYNRYSLPSNDITITSALCLTLITGILVIFFWFDIALNPFYHKSGKCLGTMRIPTIIIISLLLLLELILDTTRSFMKYDVVYIVVGIYLVLYVGLAFFYFIATWRIVVIANESNAKEKLIGITYRIAWSGVASFVAALALLGQFLVVVGNTPLLHVLFHFILAISYFVQSFLLISIFSPPVPDEKQTSDTVKSDQSTSPGSAINQ
jgi:Na+-transporting methylmalonyl-CoA/oxaloacetate decarboxylase gamma subunit